MKKLSKIQKQIFMGFGIIVTVNTLLTGLLLFELEQTHDALTDMHDNNLIPIISSSEANISLLEMDRMLLESSFTKNKSVLKHHTKKIASEEKSLDKYLEMVKNTADDEH